MRIASVIQIVLGVAGVFLDYFLLRYGDASVAEVEGNTAIGLMIASYAGYGFQMFAGLMGLLFSKKKSLFAVILGILLYVPQLIAFFNIGNNIPLIIANVVLLVIPYYYLHNAYKNFKEE